MLENNQAGNTKVTWETSLDKGHWEHQKYVKNKNAKLQRHKESVWSVENREQDRVQIQKDTGGANQGDQ